MLKAGIVGLPNVGKSTLFNALTRSRKAEAANYPFCTIDPNVGVVMGGDGLELPADQSPVPAEWRDVEGKLKEPLPITGDEFLSLAFSQSP